ncbi:ABC transporter permease subunit [Clostridium sp. 'White wine YQ']|uniref:ABC transporter permease subunit n=1 Tax=Clostridium sp. 'White wine YQ' TaxID=3027474 RepID=UPI002366193F|nr:ABC transporter permease subunit [Clostridium sp. 'White wine YQ']MDD7795944.1 ABC transporter permease subunit [Clostridium sp. 'White wine YQ']
MLFTLTKNELRKIFGRGKTYVVSILFVAFVALLFIGNNISENRAKKANSPEGRVATLKENISWLNQDMKQLEAKSASDSSVEAKKNDLKLSIDRAQAALDKLEKQIKEGTVTDDWKANLDQEITSLKQQINDETQPDRYKSQLKTRLDELNYYKTNDLKPIESWQIKGYNFIEQIIQILGMVFLAVGIAIFMSDMVSGEFTPPTMKFLIIQPVSRGKVLLSKFIAVVISCVSLILSIEVVAFLLIGLTKGFGYAKMPIMFNAKYAFDMSKAQEGGGHQLVQVAGTGEMIPQWNFTIRMFLVQILFIVACCAFVFLISSLFKTSMISMAVTTSLFTLVQILSQVLSPVKKIANFLFTSYGDAGGLLSGYMAVQYNNPNMTLAFGIAVMIITTIVFYIISHVVFTKRDILI